MGAWLVPSYCTRNKQVQKQSKKAKEQQKKCTWIDPEKNVPRRQYESDLRGELPRAACEGTGITVSENKALRSAGGVRRPQRSLRKEKRKIQHFM